MKEFLESIRSAQVPTPSLELVLALVLLAVCLIFKATRTGLLIAYLFVYRWGWLFIEETFGKQRMGLLYGYIIFGAVVVVLSIIGMLRPSDDD